MTRAHWSMAARLACSLIFTGCLAAEPIEDPDLSEGGGDGEQTEKVINGTTDNGDPNVVMLRSQSRGFCSGTLISPTVVLTAGHCLDRGAPAFVGFGVNGSSNQVAVRSAVAHPGWPRARANDIGVVILAKAVSGVTPKRISVDAREAIAGDAARVVGYGNNRTAGTGFGTKREGAVRVQRMTSGDRYTESQFVKVGSSSGTQACNGDSGGPLFFTDRGGAEKVVGVTSFGDESCTGGSFHTRVASHLGFLDDYVDIGGGGGDSTGGTNATGGSGNSTGGDSCTDRNANCSYWASRGECTKNPGYMLTNCCASCDAGGGNNTGGGESCHTVPANDSDYCTASCPCSAGEGDCDSSSECTAGLTCVQRSGTDYCERR